MVAEGGEGRRCGREHFGDSRGSGRQTGDGQEKVYVMRVQRQSYVQIGGVSLLDRWWSPIPWSGRKIDAMKRERKYR